MLMPLGAPGPADLRRLSGLSDGYQSPLGSTGDPHNAFRCGPPHPGRQGNETRSREEHASGIVSHHPVG